MLPYEEFLQVREALRKLDGGVPEPDPRYGAFHDNLSAEELARRQGVGRVDDLRCLAWPFGPEDWDGFDETVDEWRHGSQTR